jgi:glycerate 2-kinase
VGLGGSATTDGGRGALDVLQPARLSGVEIVVACDVTTVFTEAAREFGPQKGATPGQVALLTRRLERLAVDYRDRSGIDVASIPGAGAAGGLAGALATLGAQLVNGFELVADLIDLRERVAPADLVVTGEGRVDEWSFRGKAVGGVVEVADEEGVEVLVIAGQVVGEPPVPVVSLAERFGLERAMADTCGCVAELLAEHLAR